MAIVLKELFDNIEKLMEEKEPYCQPDFSLANLAKMVGSNTSYVSKCINVGAGKSFPNWVADYRIRKALQIVQANPKASTSEVGQMIGEKNTVVMRRQFRRVMGQSFSLYKAGLRES